MNVFDLRDHLVRDYADYVAGFIQIRDEKIRDTVKAEFDDGVLWPVPLIQLNPSFEPGGSVDDLVAEGLLHAECAKIFRAEKEHGPGKPLMFHRHQLDAFRAAQAGHPYVLTTGTGSGKSLSYIVPAVDHVLRHGTGKGIQAIVVYPMNALANSQKNELEKYLNLGYPDNKGKVTFARYTGQEDDKKRKEIFANPPDILLTNYVMLELILTRTGDEPIIKAAQGLRFLAFDELHTYRGRQGADVALLIRRVREALAAKDLLCVGTSATMAGPGTYDEQRAEVARVASRLFGVEIAPDQVIGETLRRSTPDMDFGVPTNQTKLRLRVADEASEPATDHASFVADPLAAWIESTFGLQREAATGRAIRAKPRSLTGPEGSAAELAALTGVPIERCAAAVQEMLLAGYRVKDPHGFPVFAFKVHQFISRGDTAYATMEPEDERHITMVRQQFVPGDRGRVLFPLVFCRECGQEYYGVRRAANAEGAGARFIPRGDQDREEENGEAGYVYISTDNPWPEAVEDMLDRLPTDMLEEHRGALRVKRSHQDKLPASLHVSPDGAIAGSLPIWYLKAPFKFCLRCGVAYGGRQSNDFSKVGTLGSEGRSTATTILALSVIRQLRQLPLDELKAEARKLLSFTDNRQDASLQAGHFNDFIEIGLLRSALFAAVAASADAGVPHDVLTQRVFDYLSLSLSDYASNPEVKFQAKADTERALRDVLGYRLYRDLRRGWRITSPNLEQCGLLAVDYVSLDEVCAEESLWKDAHPALTGASPATREHVARVLLDFMRQSLAIKVDYLAPLYQEQMQQRSSARLIEPWALDEHERMEVAPILFPRGVEPTDYEGNVYLSPRGGFGQFLRRQVTFPAYTGGKLGLDDSRAIVVQLLRALTEGGIVEVVQPAKKEGQVPGFQLNAGSLLWKRGDGKPHHDVIRKPREPEGGGRPNPFFVAFYQIMARELVGLLAREHTAQVPADERIKREEQFKTGALHVMFCSPTMELGVDIAQLNVVNMRNVPPTPANYAQRSGRAGRSGQPALVFAYCSTGSNHDQYFFRLPTRMVAGAVTPPRIDLANEDLVRAHVQAVWLAETHVDLKQTLKDVLDLTQAHLPLQEAVREQLANPHARERARQRGRAVLARLGEELTKADWFHDGWLDHAVDQALAQFDEACNRWRSLYNGARSQQDAMHAIIKDASRSVTDKEKAARLRREAEEQLKLLVESERLASGDFYSYRYFASEGFLPGYSFPRLPLAAYIPKRRHAGDNEYVSRPRFLAIAEFGPRAIIYHEGARYVVNRVIMPVHEDGALTSAAKLCGACGYYNTDARDMCEGCNALLSADDKLQGLFRLQNVSTRRRDRISSDEEERQRQGFNMRTAYRFTEVEGRMLKRIAKLEGPAGKFATLTYGQTATLYRVNLGWRRGKEAGFVLDVERGVWAANKEEHVDPDDTQGKRTERVTPYVEDRRNTLLFFPEQPLAKGVMASLQAAIKNAILHRYQLEETELAVEPLPDPEDRKGLLFYEAAEGGAGVLGHLVQDPTAWPDLARLALELCHFDPDTGEDLKQTTGMRDACEAACYHCLMSYGNQPDHLKLDRKAIRDVLLGLREVTLDASPAPMSRAEHLQRLKNLAGSELERAWLDLLEAGKHRLPDEAQHLIAEAVTRPDFYYREKMVAVYIDGPPHDHVTRQTLDAAQENDLIALGYEVMRFRHDAKSEWTAQIVKRADIFGKATATAGEPASAGA